VWASPRLPGHGLGLSAASLPGDHPGADRGGHRSRSDSWFGLKENIIIGKLHPRPAPAWSATATSAEMPDATPCPSGAAQRRRDEDLAPGLADVSGEGIRNDPFDPSGDAAGSRARRAATRGRQRRPVPRGRRLSRRRTPGPPARLGQPAGGETRCATPLCATSMKSRSSASFGRSDPSVVHPAVQHLRYARAHDRPARPPKDDRPKRQVQDAGTQGVPLSRPAVVLARVSTRRTPKKPELALRQGRPCAAHLGPWRSLLHPRRRRPQPPGALHRPRARRPCEGPARRAYKVIRAHSTPRAVRRAQPGPQPATAPKKEK